MKKYIVLLLVFVFILTGCGNKEGVKFKNDYESVNGEVNKNGKEHRVVNIDKDNPFREVSADDIVNKINKGDTFYVYFGSRLCPWCRSVIEKAIEVSKNKGIKTIYYVDIWEGKNGVPEDTHYCGKAACMKILQKFTGNPSSDIEILVQAAEELDGISVHSYRYVPISAT